MNQILISVEEVKAIISDTVKVAVTEAMLKFSVHENREEGAYLNISEAAALLHKKQSTIYALVRNRIIPSYKRGGRLLFKKQELLAWVENGKRRTSEEIEKMIAKRH